MRGTCNLQSVAKESSLVHPMLIIIVMVVFTLISYYFCFCVVLDKRKRYYTIDLFPQKCNNTDTPNSNNQTYCDTKNNDDCCNYTESSNSRCSIDYCDCSVEQQVKCYIDGKNFERLAATAL